MRKFGGKGCVPGFCKVASVRYKPVFKGHTVMVDVVNRGSAVAHGIVFNNYTQRLNSNKIIFWYFLIICNIKKNNNKHILSVVKRLVVCTLINIK